MTDVAALYQAVIVLHDRAPRNRGVLAAPTHQATVDNPLCGDDVTVQLRIDRGVIRDVGFDGHGCALSRAAASIMTTALRDADVTAARTLAADFEAFVRAPASDPVEAAALGDLAAFVGVRRFRSRQACATLPFRALVAALDQATR